MKNRGFTVIELMIAVAIIGTLSAIAVPAYQAYLGRSKASEAMNGMGSYQKAVSECFQDRGTLENCSAGQNGIPAPSTMTYGSLSVTNGVIVYTFGESALPITAGNTITFTPESSTGGANLWNCSSTLDKGYLPASCAAGIGVVESSSSPQPTASSSSTPSVAPTITPSTDVTFNGVNFSECVRLAVDTSSDTYQSCVSSAIVALTAGTNYTGTASGLCMFPDDLSTCGVSYMISDSNSGKSDAYINVLAATDYNYPAYQAIAVNQGIDLTNKLVCDVGPVVSSNGAVSCPSGSYSPVYSPTTPGEIISFKLN